MTRYVGPRGALIAKRADQGLAFADLVFIGSFRGRTPMHEHDPWWRNLAHTCRRFRSAAELGLITAG